MKRRTLARHRFARTSAEGGGGGTGTATTGTGTTGTDSTASTSGTAAGGTTNTTGDTSTGTTSDKGFPDGTPLEQMNVEQQRNYWRHYARQHETRANSRADYDAVKAKADQFDELQRQQQTPSEQAVNAAKDEGKREGARDAYSKAAAAILKTSLTGRGKSAEQAQAVVDAANLAAFVTDDGIDTAKVDSFINSIAAPVKGGPRPDPSQGPRGDNSVSGVGAGRDLFAERHKPRQAAGTNA